ncbi:Pkinase-domain-containing protein [Mycena leptocephala]|nr:Pkinase-domain-containing protein [Mycena leptocephala]
MEHLKGEVSLTDILENSALEEESQISKICFEVRRNLLKELCCLAHLHSLNFIHRDIEAGNVILDALGRLKFLRKLTGADNKCSGMVGTPFWMTPEVIKNEPYGAKMIEKEPPYLDHWRDLRKMMDLMVTKGNPTLKNPELLGCELTGFFAVCLCVHVDSRATARELLDHEFMKKVCTAAELRPMLQFNVQQSS